MESVGHHRGEFWGVVGGEDGEEMERSHTAALDLNQISEEKEVREGDNQSLRTINKKRDDQEEGFRAITP